MSTYSLTLMRIFLTLILSPFLVSAQYVDTIITTSVYKSHFDYNLKQPLFVEYILANGGGECDRSKFTFKNNTTIQMLGDKEYSSINDKTSKKLYNYDKGHLANSEDFANDCKDDELTFRYYNCIPQTPNLNRGTWKKWETTIREESKTDSLLVICGGVWKNSNTLNGVRIPSHCWKVVYSLNKNTTLHVLLFSNKNNNNTCEVITLQKLEEFLGYKVVLSYEED